MFKALNEKIRKSFSDSAHEYDLMTSLHKEIGRELIHKVIKKPKADAVLDVGCGTGYLTAKAKFFFPGARIVGLDFAQGMLDVAREKHEGIEWVLADANHLPFGEAAFDIVISNLAYQWSANLAQSFAQASRVLGKDGVLACTLFGFHTCDELFQSLNLASNGQFKSARLPSAQGVEAVLGRAGFTHTKVDYERIKLEFKDLRELMDWLKSIGANNLTREGYIGKELMAKAAAIYREQFPYHTGICATFEVIWVYANK